jgi:hypothetical protein
MQYNRFVKPAYDDFIKPTMKHADIIVPFSHSNENAVSMLVQNLQIKMQVMYKQKRDLQCGNRMRTFSDLVSVNHSSPHLRSESSSGQAKASSFSLAQNEKSRMPMQA